MAGVCRCGLLSWRWACWCRVWLGGDVRGPAGGAGPGWGLLSPGGGIRPVLLAPPLAFLVLPVRRPGAPGVRLAGLAPPAATAATLGGPGAVPGAAGSSVSVLLTGPRPSPATGSATARRAGGTGPGRAPTERVPPPRRPSATGPASCPAAARSGRGGPPGLGRLTATLQGAQDAAPLAPGSAARTGGGRARSGTTSSTRDTSGDGLAETPDQTTAAAGCPATSSTRAGARRAPATGRDPTGPAAGQTLADPRPSGPGQQPRDQTTAAAPVPGEHERQDEQDQGAVDDQGPPPAEQTERHQLDDPDDQGDQGDHDQAVTRPPAGRLRSRWPGCRRGWCSGRWWCAGRRRRHGGRRRWCLGLGAHHVSDPSSRWVGPGPVQSTPGPGRVQAVRTLSGTVPGWTSTPGLDLGWTARTVTTSARASWWPAAAWRPRRASPGAAEATCRSCPPGRRSQR